MDERNNEKSAGRIIKILAVLLIIAAAALACTYIYRAATGSGDDVVSLPGNLAVSEEGEELGGESNDGEDGGLQAGSGGSSTGGQTGQGGGASTGGQGGQTDQSGEDQTTAEYIELCKGEAAANRPFSVQNMLPGDKITQYYRIRVHHDEDIELYFQTEITEETRELGDALKVRVTRLDAGDVVCDGTFSAINKKEYAQMLKASDADQTTIYYMAEAYLETSAGNQYQEALLKADFKWYIKDAGQEGLISKTGDRLNLILWVVAAVCALALASVLFFQRRNNADKAESRPAAEKRSGSGTKLLSSAALIAVLGAMLTVTSFALLSSMIAIKDNTFQTGRVKIDLNGGEPVLSAEEDGGHLNIEPGHTIKKEFYIENESSVDAYYRIYLENVDGELADVLIFSIMDEDGELAFTGTAEQLSENSPYVERQPLAAGLTAELTMTVKMPESAGDEFQGDSLTFDVTADAVQARNNDSIQFE